jgi:hypothetical protein
VIFWWVFKRHFAVIPVIGLGGAAIWYHAGSWVRSCGVSLSASRFRLYFLATFSIRAESFPIRLARCPRVAGFHICRKLFPLAFWIVAGGADRSMSASVTMAHGRRAGERSS